MNQRGTSNTLQLLTSKPSGQAGVSSSLRFLDLPHDFRLMIYRDLLIRPRKSTCNTRLWPAILTTCKHIRAQAEEILYAENTFAVKLSIGKEHPSPRLHRQIVLGGEQRDYRSCPRGHVFRSFVWPEALRKARKVTVQVKVRNTSLKLNRLAIHHALLGLFLFLDAASSIRHLTFALLDKREIDAGHLTQTFWPLVVFGTCTPGREIKLRNVSSQITRVLDRACRRSHGALEQDLKNFGSLVRMVARMVQRLNDASRWRDNDDLTLKAIQCLAELGHVEEGKSQEVGHAVQRLQDIINWITAAIRVRR